MNLDDVVELHYITPIGNLPSILKHGILCNQRASKMEHDSVAMQDVQKLRRRVRIPVGDNSRPLHSYANMYFTARNPMMYVRQGSHRDLCVLRVQKDALYQAGVVVTDRNATSDHKRLGAGAAGVAIIDKDLVFAKYWTDNDPIAYYRKKSAKCAEVLIPDRLDPSFLIGAYVSIIENIQRIKQLCVLPKTFQLTVNSDLFFQ